MPASPKFDPGRPGASAASPAPAEPRARSRFEPVYQIGGPVVGALLGFATAIMEAVLTPLHVGSVRAPIAPLLALIGNVGLVWFAYTVTRRPGLSLVPGVVWFLTLFVAATRTSEGDLIVTGTWVSFLTLLLGSLGWAGAGYFVILRRAVIPRGAAMPNRTATARAAKAGAAGPSAPVGNAGPAAKKGSGTGAKRGSDQRPAN